MAKKQMTEEEKAAFAEKMAQSRAKKKAEEEAKKIAEEPKPKSELELLREQNELLMKQLAQLQDKMTAQPQIIKMSEPDKVHFLWQAEVADDNIVFLGEGGRYGRIVGKTGEVFVPKNELTNMLDEFTRGFMDRRWLIVLDGLTDEEREAYNVKYSDGETLDKKQFAKITEMGDKLLDIYPKLCREHQIMVAKRFVEAYETGKKKLSRDLIVNLNNLSKKAGSKKGDFVTIIEAMNSKELNEGTNEE